MSNAKHTPGPWEVFGRPEDPIIALPGIEGNNRNYSIIEFKSSSDKVGLGVQGRTKEEAWANARLIAAAPELLEALQGCLDALREASKSFAVHNPNAAHPNLFDLHAHVAVNTIAKAKGEA